MRLYGGSCAGRLLPVAQVWRDLSRPAAAGCASRRGPVRPQHRLPPGAGCWPLFSAAWCLEQIVFCSAHSSTPPLAFQGGRAGLRTNHRFGSPCFGRGTSLDIGEHDPDAATWNQPPRRRPSTVPGGRFGIYL